MSFLRRLFGRTTDEPAEPDPVTAHDAGPAAGSTSADDDERALELELARSEQARLDELQQRQLRYAKHVWTPPAQGGERRADDEDERRGE